MMLIIIMRDFGIEVGNRLQELRKNAGYTQEQLAEKLNISSNALSNYETGIRLMRIDTAKEVSDALGITVDYLLTGNMTEVDIDYVNHKDFFHVACSLLLKLKKPMTQKMALKHLEIVLWAEDM